MKKTIITLSLLTTLTACGGGSGGSAVTPSAPIYTAYIVGTGGTILRSTDGNTWTQDTSSPTTNNLYDITYFYAIPQYIEPNPHFIVVGDNGTELYNESGTWAIGWTGLDNAHLHKISAYVNTYEGTDVYVQVAGANENYSSGEFYYALDGYENGWQVLSAEYPLYSVTTDSNNDVFAVGWNGLIALDLGGEGREWQDYLPSNTKANLVGVASDGRESGIVAVGVGGVITTDMNYSDIYDTWTIESSNTTHDLYDVEYLNNQWIASGESGTIITSPDGINWTVQNTPTTNYLHRISYWQGNYYVPGDNGTILKSSDSVNWYLVNSGTTQDLYSMAGEFN